MAPKSNSDYVPQPYTNQNIFKSLLSVQERCLFHIVQQTESSRDMIQWWENSCLRDTFMFFLSHTSSRKPIAMIGSQCWSRADSLQPGTVEAGRVMPYTRTS